VFCAVFGVTNTLKVAVYCGSSRIPSMDDPTPAQKANLISQNLPGTSNINVPCCCLNVPCSCLNVPYCSFSQGLSPPMDELMAGQKANLISQNLPRTSNIHLLPSSILAHSNRLANLQTRKGACPELPAKVRS
jgi:hypothetical protein